MTGRLARIFCARRYWNGAQPYPVSQGDVPEEGEVVIKVKRAQSLRRATEGKKAKGEGSSGIERSLEIIRVTGESGDDAGT